LLFSFSLEKQEILKSLKFIGNISNSHIVEFNFSSLSLVLTSKDGDYLVLTGNRNYPTTTSAVFNTIIDNGEIVWVTPKFNDLNTSTDREYNNLSTFVEKYKK
jgi:hypothetical protein